MMIMIMIRGIMILSSQFFSKGFLKIIVTFPSSFLRNTEWTSRFGALEAQLIYDLGRERNAGRLGAGSPRFFPESNVSYTNI